MSSSVSRPRRAEGIARHPPLATIGRRRPSPSRRRRLASCHYGMGGLGKGATPQIAVAQGGSGGVGMRESFPWVDAEAFAVPGVPVVHVPINVFRLGYGFVK